MLLLFWMVHGAKGKRQGSGAGRVSLLHCAGVCCKQAAVLIRETLLHAAAHTAHTSLEQYVLNSSVFQKGIVFFPKENCWLRGLYKVALN